MALLSVMHLITFQSTKKFYKLASSPGPIYLSVFHVQCCKDRGAWGRAYLQATVFTFNLQGCWRKVTVDDLLPFLEQPASDATAGGDGTATNADVGNTGETATEVNYVPLYPRTANPVELWPAILTKAVLKIAALE